MKKKNLIFNFLIYNYSVFTVYVFLKNVKNVLHIIHNLSEGSEIYMIHITSLNKN